jgi:hypothetical protein
MCVVKRSRDRADEAIYVMSSVRGADLRSLYK